MQKALLSLDKLKAKLETIERQRKEPIAIVGLSCRFPAGASSPEAFFKLLLDGVDAVSEVPEGRWLETIPVNDHTIRAARWGAFLKEDIRAFEPSFFGISPREAERLDPQQRLLLELTWEALECAGIVPASLIGSRTGVFVGLMTTDYMQLTVEAPESAWDGYSATGTAHCFPAGRIAYTFGFQGPTMVVDTACSSSLVAAHLACQSLRTGESEVGVVAGVNLLLSPVTSKLTAKLNALSADGRCKTFDAHADGYVRGEGGAVLILKRLSDAQRDGDPIFALIRGSAVNQDGRSTGLTTPNVLAQKDVLRQALSASRVSAEEVGYVEAHGTGTPLGDPIEVEALRAVYGLPRADAYPCVLGALKTNIGHLEAGAGIAGLVKTTMVLQKGWIPRNLHLRAMNPRITMDGTPLVPAIENRRWERGERPRMAGVSSFGLSGTNAHVILEEAPVEPAAEETAGRDRRSLLLPLSAKSPEALRALASAYSRMLVERGGEPLYDIVHTASLRRTHHEHRLTVTGQSGAEMASALSAFARDGAAPGVTHGRAAPMARQKIVFVFPGQGSQWLGMGKQLFNEEPVFRSSMELCHETIRRHGTFSLIDELHADEQSSRLSEIDVVQPMIFAIQVSLAALWRSFGVEPDAVVGHSMGEVAAARVANILSAEDAAKVICRRSRMLLRVAGQGAMAHVELSAAEAREAIVGFESVVSVAVHNGPRSTVLSGDTAALETVLRTLESKGIFCRRVNVDVASHSPQVDPITEDLAAVLNLRPRAAQTPMISTVTAEPVRGPEMTAEYWIKNLREPVLFSEVTQSLLDDRHVLFLELSSHPLLLRAIEESLQARGHEGTALPSLRRNTDERGSMLESLGALHAQGVPVSFKTLVPFRGRVVQLPSYTWQRERYWIDVVSPGSPQQGSLTRERGPAPLLGPEVATAQRPGARIWQRTIGVSSMPFLAQHKLQGEVILPGSIYLEAAFEAARELFGERGVALRDVDFLSPMTLPPNGDILVEVCALPSESGLWEFRWSSLTPPGPGGGREWTLHATAQIAPLASPPASANPPSTARSRCSESVSIEAIDEASKRLGLDVGPAFRTVREVWRGAGEVFARIDQPEGAGHDFLVHPAVLDACLRTLVVGLSGARGEPRVLSAIHEVRLRLPAEGQVVVEGSAPSPGNPEAPASLRLYSTDGRTLVEIDGVRSQAISPDLLLLRGMPEVVFRVEWMPAPRASERVDSPGHWLLVDVGEGTGRGLRRALEGRGATVEVVAPNDVARAMADAPSREPLSGVVCLADLALEPASGDDLAVSLEQACGGALSVAKALIERGSRSPRLFLVTRGTQAVGDSKAPVAMTSATVWGLGRAIATEHPELGCCRIDLDVRAHLDDVAALVTELFSRAGGQPLSSDDDEIALRMEGRFVPRIVRGRLPAEPGRSPVREDKTYLVTGGLGGLGLIAAEELVSEGARHLVLVGRSGLKAPHAIAVVERLRATGASINVVQADISDGRQLDVLFRNIASRMPVLAGVLHTAGALDDGLIENQSWERFARVFAAKVLGAYELHLRTKDMHLDFFVLYSSMSALIAPPGVSNYVAANAFLDALAHARRAEGLVGTAVNWGLFSDVGMGAKAVTSARTTSDTARGFGPKEGAALLRAVLRGGFTQVGLAMLDFQRLANAQPSIATAPRFRDLLAAARGQTGAQEVHTQQSTSKHLISLSREGRERALHQHVRAQLGKILRIDPQRVDMTEPLSHHGFDSLMGMELRGFIERTLGLRVSVGDILSNARGESLVALILARFSESPPAPVDGAVPAELASRRVDDAVRTGARGAIPEVLNMACDQSFRGHSGLELNAPAPNTQTAQRVVTTAGGSREREGGLERLGSWVVVPRRLPEARMRLFCFPYAGGAASVFSGWAADLPPEIEVCAIQLPGRYERFHEPMLRSVSEMVKPLVRDLLPYLDKPFATFGHCLGAILMFEVLRELRRTHEKRPIQVFSSGAPAPHRYVVPNLSSLPDDEFVSLLGTIGFAQESVLRDGDAVKDLLPAVKADFAAAEGYIYTDGALLDAPVTALAGLQDGFAPNDVVNDWRRETTSWFSKLTLPGGHYFIVPERRSVLAHVAVECMARLAESDQNTRADASADPWIVRTTTRRAPRARLIVVPGLGEDASAYQAWGNTVGEALDLWVLERPGAGRREAELPLGRVQDIAAHGARALLRLPELPFVLCGLDLGALAAFEIARLLRHLGAQGPTHLVVASAMAPDLHYFAPIHHLSDDVFAAELSRMRLDPRVPARTLRADLAAFAGYAFAREAPLDIPVSIFAAEHSFTPLAGARGWSRHTQAESSFHTRAGGHRWMPADRSLILDVVKKHIARTARTDEPEKILEDVGA